jgi:hypothetical protein
MMFFAWRPGRAERGCDARDCGEGRQDIDQNRDAIGHLLAPDVATGGSCHYPQYHRAHRFRRQRVGGRAERHIVAERGQAEQCDTKHEPGITDMKPDCTDAPTRRVLRMADEDVRDRVRALENTPAFVRSPRHRKRVERLFGQLKRNMGLRRLKLRGLRGVAEEFTLAAAAQNLILLTRRRTAG